MFSLFDGSLSCLVYSQLLKSYLGSQRINRLLKDHSFSGLVALRKLQKSKLICKENRRFICYSWYFNSPAVASSFEYFRPISSLFSLHKITYNSQLRRYLNAADAGTSPASLACCVFKSTLSFSF